MQFKIEQENKQTKKQSIDTLIGFVFFLIYSFYLFFYYYYFYRFVVHLKNKQKLEKWFQSVFGDTIAYRVGFFFVTFFCILLCSKFDSNVNWFTINVTQKRNDSNIRT